MSASGEEVQICMDSDEPYGARAPYSPAVSPTTVPVIGYPFQNLVDALRFAAHTEEGIIIYRPNQIGDPSAAHRLSYRELLLRAEERAVTLRETKTSDDCVVPFYVEDMADGIIWIWATVLAGARPIIIVVNPSNSPPVDIHRWLGRTFGMQTRKTCVNRRELVIDRDAIVMPIDRPGPSDIFAFMLTLGNGGGPNVVPLTHGQVLAACRGKAYAANLRYPNSPFLSWVGMHHVSNFIHCHVFAIVSQVSQILVPPTDILMDPLQLLNLVSRHRVSRTFVPSSFLVQLSRQLMSDRLRYLDPNLNLETLCLDTGGEANMADTCIALQFLLSQYGAPKNAIRPSFGMAETCAGCIFNKQCPAYDETERLQITTFGKCIPGVQMRITRLDCSWIEAMPGHRGSLELTGEVIFKGYYNNPRATAKAFTDDGWFRTGDLAYIDDSGNLLIDGRINEVITFYETKICPQDLDADLERADIPGARPGYFCTFGRHDEESKMEYIVVLYVPTFDENNHHARHETQCKINTVVGNRIYQAPIVVPLREVDMPRSTLGKLPRMRLKKAFEGGYFAHQHHSNHDAIRNYRKNFITDPETPEEIFVLQIVRELKEIGLEEDIDVNESIIVLGVWIHTLRIMNLINQSYSAVIPLCLIDMFEYPTVRSLAQRIKANAIKHTYDPVVVIKPRGNKVPLWLVHSAVGEVLPFVNVAKHLSDRPLLAFRSRGFTRDDGERPFGSLEEMVSTYYTAIKTRQPQGPYAIAGYLFGGIVAFEIAKRLERDGDEVRYCGCWNIPPHTNFHMRELSWDECLIHLFYLLELLSEYEGPKHKPVLAAFNRERRVLSAIQYLKEYCDQGRWEDMGFTEEYYLKWVDLMVNIKRTAVDYAPTGSVKCMDIFVADPPSQVAKDRDDWVSNQLAAWKGFVRQDLQCHDVQGGHYTMLSDDFVRDFTETLQNILRARGL